MQRSAAALATILMLSCASAFAQDIDDRKACNELKGPDAIAACTRAILSGRYSGADLARIYTNRGVEHRRTGDLDAAIADYSEAIKVHPDDPFAYNNRANARRDKGDIDGAIADYTEALRIDPDYTAAYVNRGLVYERKHDIARARADYEQALARPAKYGNGRGGQEMARRRLAQLSKRL